MLMPRPIARTVAKLVKRLMDDMVIPPLSHAQLFLVVRLQNRCGKLRFCGADPGPVGLRRGCCQGVGFPFTVGRWTVERRRCRVRPGANEEMGGRNGNANSGHRCRWPYYGTPRRGAPLSRRPLEGPGYKPVAGRPALGPGPAGPARNALRLQPQAQGQ